MATLPSSIPPSPLDPLWRMSVDQYHAMIDAGILSSDSPVELIEGILVRKMGKNPSHRFTNRETRVALEEITPQGWYVDDQAPITLSDSEPEPDVLVARGRSENYRHRHPGPADIALVVEISESSLNRDRAIKTRVYARERIPCYWILDLTSSRVEVRTEPIDGACRVVTVYSATDEIPVVIDGTEIGRIPAARLFGPTS